MISESELLVTPSSPPPHSIKQTTINRVCLHPFTNRIPTPATSSRQAVAGGCSYYRVHPLNFQSALWFVYQDNARTVRSDV